MSSIKTILKYLFNRKAIKDPKPINKKTLSVFLQGNLRAILKHFDSVPENILEEASWRKTQVLLKNPKCIELGKCDYCECSIEETLLSDPACKHGCYPHMRNKEEWENFKLQNNIIIEEDDKDQSNII
jgi:hypothetical protein